MKKFDITEYLCDFVGDHEILIGEKITVELEGRDICTAEVMVVGDGLIEFKVKIKR